MSNRHSSKLKILYIMKILLEQTDEKHVMTISQLIAKLAIYGIEAERKAIYKDIELLTEFGLDIICVKSRSNEYFVASREFEIPELRMMIDAISSTKTISYKKSKLLIQKVERLTSIHEAKRIHKNISLDDQVKNTNEEIYYNVDKIENAIKDNMRIKFKYFDYTIDKTRKLRRNGEWYEVSPYALTWAEDHYYMVAYYKFYDCISNFRVDRMLSIETINERRVLLEGAKYFNVADYKKKNFRMYGGEPVMVKVQFDNSLVNPVLDRFGKDITLYKTTEKCFHINIEVVPSHTFYSWLFMFGDKVKIVSPEEIRNKMQLMAQDIVTLYNE